ncbi:hypothetical protein PUW24_00350 (plasmid) [Paenibacillus urinalis]|uniref:Uncharacterized protein n=1 Tax=Paenibacillus urinalis TaxID=521520 RepID=A0AAX3N6P6_9BACL|nr:MULTISPECIES: hypothetical protein [Paenibacillus]MCM3131125.1 hypothetical protein [Paenibacillus sp. MER 78]WDH85333.1 hypothetical protein PUW23_26220 [Paenibacillus urinalis]WDH95227.1 hypothetical protein PUW24_00350 [Paenibacillus urinalis]WDI05296.1 hypothetical protein PUW25_27135 [Paenibacillus urinalis]
MMKKVIIAGSVLAGVLFCTFLVTEIMPKQEPVHFKLRPFFVTYRYDPSRLQRSLNQTE